MCQMNENKEIIYDILNINHQGWTVNIFEEKTSQDPW